MHELGIVFHVIQTLEEVGRKNELSSVGSVTLQLGEVSGVVEGYLTDCWKWAAAKSELLKNSQLNIEKTAAITLCESCHNTYKTVLHGRICPFCGSEKTVLQCGNEINILQIEAY